MLVAIGLAEGGIRTTIRFSAPAPNSPPQEQYVMRYYTPICLGCKHLKLKEKYQSADPLHHRRDGKAPTRLVFRFVDIVLHLQLVDGCLVCALERL
jgi:hypothetical protein